MTSALKPTGSTRAWRKLRATWADRIAHAHATGNPITCRRTGKPIHPEDDWDLGHHTDRAKGGNDQNLWPEHAHPNRAAGATKKPTKRTW